MEEIKINISRNIRYHPRIDLKFVKPYKLNIGCGDMEHRQERDLLHGYLGIDILDYGQEIVWDIEKGLPLGDNSCIEVYCSHVVEHINDMIFLMNEFWRILRPEGILHIVCPEINNTNAYIVTHIRQLTIRSFEMFSIEWQPKQEWFNNYNVYPWKIIELLVNDRKDIHFKASPAK